MNDEVRNLSDSAHEQLNEMIKDHEATMKRMRDEMEHSMTLAAKRFENMASNLLSSTQPESKVEQKPVAVWQEADGQKFLVMNEAAVNSQMDLLSKLADLLPELQKALTPRGAGVLPNITQLMNR